MFRIAIALIGGGLMATVDPESDNASYVKRGARGPAPEAVAAAGSASPSRTRSDRCRQFTAGIRPSTMHARKNIQYAACQHTPRAVTG